MYQCLYTILNYIVIIDIIISYHHVKLAFAHAYIVPNEVSTAIWRQKKITKHSKAVMTFYSWFDFYRSRSLEDTLYCFKKNGSSQHLYTNT